MIPIYWDGSSQLIQLLQQPPPLSRLRSLDAVGRHGFTAPKPLMPWKFKADNVYYVIFIYHITHRRRVLSRH